MRLIFDDYTDISWFACIAFQLILRCCTPELVVIMVWCLRRQSTIGTNDDLIYCCIYICLNGLSTQGHYEVHKYINAQQRASLRRWLIRHRSDTMLLVRCQNDVRDRHLPPYAYLLVAASFASMTFVSVRLVGCSMSLESRIEVLRDDWATVWYPLNIVKSQQPIWRPGNWRFYPRGP